MDRYRARAHVASLGRSRCHHAEVCGRPCDLFTADRDGARWLLQYVGHEVSGEGGENEELGRDPLPVHYFIRRRLAP